MNKSTNNYKIITERDVLNAKWYMRYLEIIITIIKKIFDLAGLLGQPNYQAKSGCQWKSYLGMGVHGDEEEVLFWELFCLFACLFVSY